MESRSEQSRGFQPLGNARKVHLYPLSGQHRELHIMKHNNGECASGAVSQTCSIFRIASE